jgi:hypothetical protein
VRLIAYSPGWPKSCAIVAQHEESDSWAHLTTEDEARTLQPKGTLVDSVTLTLRSGGALICTDVGMLLAQETPKVPSLFL